MRPKAPRDGWAFDRRKDISCVKIRGNEEKGGTDAGRTEDRVAAR